jgi:hypothetical protein
MNQGLINLDAKDFGLEESKAKQIAEQFKPMLDKMIELEKEANEVFSLNLEDPNTAKKAKEVRLKYVKVRTGTSDIHKQQKSFYLQAGRFVDGWKNAQLFASQGIEDKLQYIENYFEIKEKERIQKVQKERLLLVEPFLESTFGLDLGNMSKETFDNFLLGSKTNFEAKKEAERLEAERLEKERLAEIERQKEIEKENARLKAEAEAKQKELEKERTKLEAERKANEQKIAEEREKAKAEADRIESEILAKLKAEQEEKAKIEAELKAKKEAEEKQEAERLAKIEAEKKEAEKLAKEPVKKQLSVWVNSFELPETNLENDKTEEIKAKFDSFKKWCLMQIKNI